MPFLCEIGGNQHLTLHEKDLFLLTVPFCRRGMSYKSLLKPLTEDASSLVLERGLVHDPNYLDDPKMAHGSSRHESRGDAKRGPIIYSIIQFKNKKELKEQLNEQFRDRHPQLPPSLTFSKIRNLKKSLLLGCLRLDFEVSTAAIAWICFERLCLQGLVFKINRHLTMAVCLVLAFKFLEPLPGNSSRLEALLSFTDREWEVSRSEIFEAEFGAFVKLEFLLHLPYQHIQAVYAKLLKLVRKTSSRYLGDAMSDVYAFDVSMLEGMGNNDEQDAVLGDEEEEEDPAENETSDEAQRKKEEEETLRFETRIPFFRGSTFSFPSLSLGGGDSSSSSGAAADGSSATPILSILGFGRRTPSSADLNPPTTLSTAGSPRNAINTPVQVD